MPGRTSSRTTTRQSTTSRTSTAAVSRKSSAATLKSRSSTASRFSSANVIIPEEPATSALRVQICSIFSDTQRTTAGHRKSVIKLRKIQEACCYEPTSNSGKDTRDFDEDEFNYEVGRCTVRLVAVKKAEPAGDRVVRFLGLYLSHANEKDNTLVAEEYDEGFAETPSSRLTSYILSLVLPFLASKEKTVRFRSTQLISHIINSLDSIDDDLFQQLRLGLLKRVRDKESMVRVQAVLGLGRLAGNETEGDPNGDDSDDEDAGGLLEKLLDVLQNDPSADVRRSLLLNLPLTPTTLPYLLERARDLDPATRRALYSRLLPSLGDFRHLSLSMREKLLRWGLRDRDENVRKAAGKLFRERWIEDCTTTQSTVQECSQEGNAVAEARSPNFEGLKELLERIDVVNSGVESGVAQEAMKCFWEGRADYREEVVFDDSFWDGLTAESAFIARSFNDFCRQQGDAKFEDLVEEKMPEVTKLAFFLQRFINKLLDSLRRAAEQGDDAEDDDTAELEFIVEQLLQIAQTLDYTDEVGRRKMYALLREILALPELPEEVTRLIVEGLRGVCGGDPAGEREFCGVVLEAIAEVHDTITGDDVEEEETDPDESFHSAKSELSEDMPKRLKTSRSRSPEVDENDEEKAMKEILVNMKCLYITQCMLENVEGNLQQNIHLVTMLNNLVVPAVRSHEAPVRERGLTCLGLCCLLDKTLAEENLTLFLHCFNKGHDALQTAAIQIISDILTVHGSSLLSSPTCPVEEKMLYKMFSKALKADDKIGVQAAACEAACKLMLGLVVKDEELLKTLVVAYFDPGTAENLGLRQGLSYFLPVYCHSRAENQMRMQEIAVAALHSLILLHDNLDEEEEMVTPVMIASHLVDWTDPRKVVSVRDMEALADDIGRKEISKSIDGTVHMDLAKDVLEKIASNASKEEKKVFCSVLGKLYVSKYSDVEKIRTVYELASQIVEDKLLSDAPSRNALNKLYVALGKIIDSLGEAEGVDEEHGEETKITPIDAEEEEEPEEADEGLEDAAATVRLTDPKDDSLLGELLDDELESELDDSF
ncbi:hypothetical protein FGG08_000050 [Glutinoglossum americanum]|uniref:Nuclear condensin complex subunit 3 C-terminal domain-containing protein n=1 Tax=Glutinoglossum americanum TaxID=1670608 RepID=A0A9P8I9V5_9PEZI|nr:hypothetical protein FGG08_000050 [Glutinoglossum americanum]